MTEMVRCTASALKIRSLPTLGLGSDTGKRMIHRQIATVYGESLDEKWAYVDAPAGRGWCSKDYLEDLVPTVDPITSGGWPKVPNGLAEIYRIFGSPGSAAASAGRCQLPAPLKLGWVNTSVSVFACHKLVEDVFESFFNEVYRRGLYNCIDSIAACIETFDGAYNDRTVTASQKVSTHAWGIAFDINASKNPLGRKPTMDPRIVAIGRDHQLVWGGQWKRPDGMHFQYATGY